MTSSEPRSTAAAKYFTGNAVKESTGGAITRLVIGFILTTLSGLGLFSFVLYEILEFNGLIIEYLYIYTYDGWLWAIEAFVLLIGLILFIGGWSRLVSINRSYRMEVALKEPKPSDAQMDAWMAADKARIINDAMAKLELVADSVINASDPLVVIGPATGTKIKSGQDGIFRLSRYEIVIIYLTDYHLGAYSCELDFITGTVTMEQTQEYHYTDVVSVATLISNSPFQIQTIDGMMHPIARSQEFSLSVASGQSIRVAVAFHQLPEMLKTGRLAPTGAEKAISTLRTMLREKKGGAAHI